MKICFLSYTLSPGGFSSRLLSMTEALANRGNEITVRLYRPARQSFDLPRGVEFQIRQRPNPKIKKLLKLLSDPRLWPALLKGVFGGLLLKRPRDRLKYSQLLAYLDAVTSPMEDLSRYDCAVAWEEAFPSYLLSRRAKAKKKIGYIHADYTEGGFSKALDKKGYKNLDRIFCVSKANAGKVRRRLGGPPDRYRRVYNLLRPALIKSKSGEYDPGFDKNVFNIVTVCRLEDSSKALFRLRQVAGRLRREGFDFRWHVIGDGPDRAEFEKAVKRSGAEGRVLTYGNRQNPFPFVAARDLFALPSRYEGKPMAVEEALILKKPVLITDYASATEQVEDGVNGFICQNSREGIYLALKRILETPRLLALTEERLKTADLSKYCDPSDFLRALDF